MTMRLPLWRPPSFAPAPGQLIVASYGGGVNSVASLAWLKRNGYRPHAIVMADPGSERIATETYRDGIMSEWLAAVGFPPVTVIDRITEGQYNARAWRLETLIGEVTRRKTLPSIAYGPKKCSAKYKGDTQRWWVARQEWAISEWAAERKLVRLIGYDRGESSRVLASSPNKWELARFDVWFPLHDNDLDRDDCEALIEDEGLPCPPKSACKFCPANTLEEWEQLRADDPAGFAEAVEMSRNATTVTTPDVVGLMRCNPPGMRQLHEWADGKYDPAELSYELDNPLPCECAL
jgi:hypothetical protein